MKKNFKKENIEEIDMKIRLKKINKGKNTKEIQKFYLFFFTWYKNWSKKSKFLINSMLIKMYFIKIEDQLILITQKLEG